MHMVEGPVAVQERAAQRACSWQEYTRSVANMVSSVVENVQDARRGEHAVETTRLKMVALEERLEHERHLKAISTSCDEWSDAWGVPRWLFNCVHVLAD